MIPTVLSAGQLYNVGVRALLVVCGLLFARSAQAHDGAHDDMPHQVTAGLIPIYVTAYDGAHPGLTEGPIDELNIGAIGVTVGYGHTLWRLLELRIRSEYIKPFPSRDALRSGLHEFRGVVGVSGVIPLAGDRLQLALGPEAGVAAWRLTAVENDDAFSASHALGYTLSFATSLRGWVTYHTGFWAELGFGTADGSHAGDAPGSGIASRWPLRVALGWADRF